MKIKKHKLNAASFLATFSIALALAFPNTAAASGALGAANPSQTSADDRFHALELTRFHFMTLKQFHSNIFSTGRGSELISESTAYLLNTGLNSFLTSPERETLLLEALRQEKAVELRFSVPEESPVPQVVNHPTKPLLYRLVPVITKVPVIILIRPLLDGPSAFEISLSKGNERYSYEVNWAGILR